MRTQQTVARHLLLLSALVLPLDQVLKWLTREYLHETYEYFLGPLFIRFEWAENPGAFLSLGSSWSDATRFWVLTVMVTGILAWAAWTLFRKRDMPAYEYWSLQLLLVGGAGNLIDRAWRGTVTDYVQVGLGPLQTGIFNLVDMLILAALFLMLLGPWASSAAERQKNLGS